MKVTFTDHAKSNLRSIFKHYKDVASVRVAKSIKTKIIASTKDLANFVNKFQEEEYLKIMNVGHRRYISGNYKIIYKLEKQQIIITDIFDTRQDPNKIEG